jgi:hypothetical protein
VPDPDTPEAAVVRARRAEERDLPAFCRICADGRRETYRELL